MTDSILHDESPKFNNKPLPPQPWNESDAAFKIRMVEEGNWRPFLLERAAYRFRGLGVHWANRFAQQHYPPPEFPVKAIRTGISPGECGLGPYGLTELKMRTRVVDQLGIAGSARTSEFEGRDCSFNKAVEWVAENLGIKVVRQDAPSKQAWSIYEWASFHPGNKSKFYEGYLSRRYRPGASEEDAFDPGEGLSVEGEDVGLPAEPVGLPGESVDADTLPEGPSGSEGECGVASEDELSSYSLR